MTKEQILNTIMLLAAMESASLSQGLRLPTYLDDWLSECTENLTKELLK